MISSYKSCSHWRQPRRGCRGHIPQFLWLGDVNGNIPPILLRTCTFGYSRPILVALRSLSLKPISFGYKTPPIRPSQAGGQSAHKARPPNLELALKPLGHTPKGWRKKWRHKLITIILSDLNRFTKFFHWKLPR